MSSDYFGDEPLATEPIRIPTEPTTEEILLESSFKPSDPNDVTEPMFGSVDPDAMQRNADLAENGFDIKSEDKDVTYSEDAEEETDEDSKAKYAFTEDGLSTFDNLRPKSYPSEAQMWKDRYFKLLSVVNTFQN